MNENDPGDETIEVGTDGRARLEKDMGLKMDPDTGRAYESQGNAHNMSTGINGTFHDGVMVPRCFRCESCETVQYEERWAGGYKNAGQITLNPGVYMFRRCGSINLGAGGQYNLCGTCLEVAVRALPNLAGMVSAMNGGTVHRRG